VLREATATPIQGAADEGTAVATQEKTGGRVVQTWLPHPLDQELRRHAKAERRSLSSAIRIAVEDKLKERRR
jgi:hypothetical protein